MDAVVPPEPTTAPVDPAAAPVAAAVGATASAESPAGSATAEPTTIVPGAVPWSDPHTTAGTGTGITILGPVAATSAAAAPLVWVEEDGDGSDDGDSSDNGSADPGGSADRGSSDDGDETPEVVPDAVVPDPAPVARTGEEPAGVGAVIDPGPLKIVTLEDIEMAAQKEQADADLSALIAPVRSDPVDAEYGDDDG